MVTVYSVCTALLFFCLMLALIALLHHHTKILGQRSISMLLFASALAVLRLFLPLDLHIAYIYRSWHTLPAVLDFFTAYPAVGYLLLAVWAGGAVRIMARDLRALLYARRVFRSFTVVKNQRVEQIAAKLDVNCPVLVSPDVSIPCASGIFRHTIYLPDSGLPDGEIGAALLHEAQHIRSHDNEIKLSFWLLSALLWCVPFVYRFRRALHDILELRCDEEVTKPMDTASQFAYLKMLTNMVSRLAADKHPVAAVNQSLLLGDNPDVIKRRLERISDHITKPPRKMGVALPCCAVALFLASYMIIFQPGFLPAENDFQGVSGVNYYDGYDDALSNADEGTFILKRLNGQYELYVDYIRYKYLSIDEVNSERYADIPIYEEATES